MGEKTGVMLAISPHVVTDELRDELVPLNKKYPIAEPFEACRNWSAFPMPNASPLKVSC